MGERNYTQHTLILRNIINFNYRCTFTSKEDDGTVQRSTWQHPKWWASKIKSAPAKKTATKVHISAHSSIFACC